MKKLSLLCAATVYMLVLTTGCGGNGNTSTATVVNDSSAAFNASAMQKTIDDKNAAFAKAFITGDSAGMVNNYTVDGKIFAPNAAAVIGRPAISALVSQYLKIGIKEFHDVTTALYGNEDNLIEEGNFFMGDGKGNTIDKGNYIDIWRKVDGEWKVYSNMFNSSLPLPAAK